MPPGEKNSCSVGRVRVEMSLVGMGQAASIILIQAIRRAVLPYSPDDAGRNQKGNGRLSGRPGRGYQEIRALSSTISRHSLPGEPIVSVLFLLAESAVF